MKRFIEEEIEKWINKKDKALLITGARQVGKTYIIRKTLKQNDIPFFEINFYDRPDTVKELSRIENVQDFVTRLSLYSDIPLERGKTVIFFDEVQAFPDIITKIKFLVQEGSFRYVLSGFLLGVELKNIRSLPIGYMDELKMYPMSLFEFVSALGMNQQSLDHIQDCFTYKKPVDAIVHNRMLNYFWYYLVTGGMPKAVKTFIETTNLSRVDEVQKTIVNQYHADFFKYQSDDKKLRLISIYDNVPSQLNKQNNRFIFTHLDKELKFDRYENSFIWLQEAGVAYPCFIVQEPKRPLVLSKNTFKLFLNDVGLLVSRYPFSTKMELIEGNTSGAINNGSLFENFVAEQLYSQGVLPYYYKSKKIGEIDFLVETDLKLHALEVKSGKDYKKHKALDNLLLNNGKDIDSFIVLSTSNIETEERITYLPIYMAELIRPEKPKDVFVDLSKAKINVNLN